MYQKSNTYNDYRITHKTAFYQSSVAKSCRAQMLNLSNNYEDAYYVFQQLHHYNNEAALKKMAKFAKTTSEWKVIWKNTNFGNPLHTRAMNEIAKLAKTKAS